MPYAIVTGATQGIGKAIAEKFLSQGFSVAICARTLNDLHAVESDWKQRFTSAEIIAHRADLSVKQDVLSFARQVLERFPVIDVVVNNAGLYFPGTLIGEPEGHMETLMNVNFFSGHIFNICSVAALKAYPNGGAYSITKYALLGFSDNLRLELMPDIKVTAVCPGATMSRSWEGAGIPDERMMAAGDVAEMVWSAYNLSAGANVETIVMRPVKGDI